VGRDQTSRVRAFADLLREHRGAAGMTQEELAEAAGVAVQTIVKLESGITRAPQTGTVAKLASALRLDSQQRAEFVDAAAAGRAQVRRQSDKEPPPDIPSNENEPTEGPDEERARLLLAELNSLREENEEARRRTLAGIVRPNGMVDLPDVPDLAARLEAICGGNDSPAAGALADWLRDACAVQAELFRLLDTNTAPLRERQLLRGRLDVLRAKAGALDLLEDGELSKLAKRATELLFNRPTDLERARAAVDAYQAALARHDQWSDSEGLAT
jgi:transcriptional regulator with XRE-family HTH domain